jgi:adenosine deaminase
MTKSIDDAVEYLGANRIGHGTIASQSEKILEKLMKKNILIEVCPTSNLHTKIINSIKDQPAREFWDKNIKLSINTDDPITSDITLSNEYYKLHKFHHFSTDDFMKIGIDSIDFAFLSPYQKARLRNKYKERFVQWQKMI